MAHEQLNKIKASGMGRFSIWCISFSYIKYAENPVNRLIYVEIQIYGELKQVQGVRALGFAV